MGSDNSRFWILVFSMWLPIWCPKTQMYKLEEFSFGKSQIGWEKFNCRKENVKENWGNMQYFFNWSILSIIIILVLYLIVEEERTKIVLMFNNVSREVLFCYLRESFWPPSLPSPSTATVWPLSKFCWKTLILRTWKHFSVKSRFLFTFSSKFSRFLITFKFT